VPLARHSLPQVDFSLYLISDRRQTLGRPLVEVVEEALKGGARVLQLREKDLPDDELLGLARSLRLLTLEHGARLLINRRLDICLEVGADGVHLGADGISVAEVRRLQGRELLIGYSAHSLEEACSAEAAGASFVTFGPVYPTPSKAAYGEPLGLARLEQACVRLGIPVFALGGIKREAIGATMSSGARGIALISAVMAAPDPKTEVQSLLQAIEEHAVHSSS
jgi:thiamine-phosphate pyrophosphorylase